MQFSGEDSFNPSVGLNFNCFNFDPIMAIFEEEQIETYRKRLQNHNFVQDGIDYYRSLPDLTRDQKLQTWNHDDNESLLDNAVHNLADCIFKE